MSSTASGVPTGLPMPDYLPVPPSALGPALNGQGYCVGRVMQSLRLDYGVGSQVQP
jgi:hypothetical protein